MDRTAIVTLAIFGIAAATGVFLWLRQSAKREAVMEQFAISHGWRFLGSNRSQLDPVLHQVCPGESWLAYDIVLVQGPPAGVYLFGYSSRRGRRIYEYGFGCLAEQAGSGTEEPVTIYRRVPLVDKMLSDRIEVGGPEFSREYTVVCRRPDVAAMVVNNQVQKILLGHASTPQWFLEVRIIGRRVLVTTAWAQKPEEWEYLIAMTTRLRAAAP
jgi:hypothetical protein